MAKKNSEKFNLSVAEAELKFCNIRTAYGHYLKRLKTIPSGSGRDAVPSEFQNLEWLNPHIAHRPSSTNLRPKSPRTVESSSSPASDKEEDFSAEVMDESGVIIMVSTTNDPIETETLNLRRLMRVTESTEKQLESAPMERPHNHHEECEPGAAQMGMLLCNEWSNQGQQMLKSLRRHSQISIRVEQQ